MLEPMLSLRSDFPRYLAEKGASLPPQDRARYEKQQALVDQIVAAYEEEPEDTDRVAKLMQEMQACGPPPTELAASGLPGAEGCCIS